MDSKTLDEMWRRKACYKEVFATAILIKDAVAVHYDFSSKVYGAAPKATEKPIRAGTKVLITMISRFGDVGIRDENIYLQEHGYYARVMPEDLEQVEFFV